VISPTNGNNQQSPICSNQTPTSDLTKRSADKEWLHSDLHTAKVNVAAAYADLEYRAAAKKAAAAENNNNNNNIDNNDAEDSSNKQSAANGQLRNNADQATGRGRAAQKLATKLYCLIGQTAVQEVKAKLAKQLAKQFDNNSDQIFD
jgi:hypothetical protein